MLLEKARELFIEYLKAKERSPETISGYNVQLRLFIRYIQSTMNGYTYLDELTVEHIEGYLLFRKNHGDLPISRNRILYIIRSFYSFLMKKGYVNEDISQKIELLNVQKKERVYLQQEEVAQLIEAIEHPAIKTAVSTLALSGLRVSELCNLKLEDVEFNNNCIKVIQGKGNKDRTIPMSKKLFSLLNDYLENVRPNVNSNMFFALQSTGRLSDISINRMLHITTKKLGWTKVVTAHILRHSFASALVKKNASLPAISSLLGHSDLRVTSIYIHQNMEQLQEAVNLL